MAHLQLMQHAAPIFNANPDGGVYVITSSAAVRIFPFFLWITLTTNKGISCGGSSMAYSVSKAAGLHLMKCLASTQGPKIRVNAVLPGLLLTEWVCLVARFSMSMGFFILQERRFRNRLIEVQGLKFSEERIKQNKQAAALKQEVVHTTSLGADHADSRQTLLDDCADAYISAAKNTSMTGQQIVVGKCIHCRYTVY